MPLNCAELEKFYEGLVVRARHRGISCAITSSGMARVAFGAAQATKDCDLLCEPEGAGKSPATASPNKPLCEAVPDGAGSDPVTLLLTDLETNAPEGAGKAPATDWLYVVPPLPPAPLNAAMNAQ